MDAFDTQILLGPDHVKAIKKVNFVSKIFFFQLFTNWNLIWKRQLLAPCTIDFYMFYDYP